MRKSEYVTRQEFIVYVKTCCLSSTSALNDRKRYFDARSSSTRDRQSKQLSEHTHLNCHDRRTRDIKFYRSQSFGRGKRKTRPLLVSYFRAVIIVFSSGFGARACECGCECVSVFVRARLDSFGSPFATGQSNGFGLTYIFLLSRRMNTHPMDSVLETVRDDDFVEYCLFVRPGDANEDPEELVKNINHLNTKVLEFVDRLSNGYIWHKDRFNLIPRFCPSAELRQSFSDTSNGNTSILS